MRKLGWWLDIGANRGQFVSDAVSAAAVGTPILAVEPIPELAEMLARKFDGVVVEPVAIDLVPGTASLNVSRVGDWGISSLRNLQNVTDENVWRGRTDLRFTDVIEVSTVPLITLFERHSIESVDFIKIDVQGKDIDVLDSAGDRLKIIHSGVLEVSAVDAHSLYRGSPTLVDAITYLTARNFDVVKVKPNDPGCGELNVWFVRKGYSGGHWFKTIGIDNTALYTENDYRYALREITNRLLLGELATRVSRRIRRLASVRKP